MRRSLFFLTSHPRFDFVDLVRSQRIQNDLFLVNNQGIGVFKPVMYNMYIKFPRSPQKNMASTHRHDITKNIISILLSNGKRNTILFGYLNVTTIIKPFQRVRIGMRNSRNTKLLNKESGAYVGATAFINDQVANLIFDGAPGVEDHFPLCLLMYLAKKRVQT